MDFCWSLVVSSFVMSSFLLFLVVLLLVSSPFVSDVVLLSVSMLGRVNILFFMTFLRLFSKCHCKTLLSIYLEAVRLHGFSLLYGSSRLHIPCYE
jgi:hypothetical protein